jgi:hypothetical protein
LLAGTLARSSAVFLVSPFGMDLFDFMSKFIVFRDGPHKNAVGSAKFQRLERFRSNFHET